MGAFGGTYTTGTIDLVAGSTTVNGTGVLWTDVAEGDEIMANGLTAMIDSAPTTSQIILKNGWPGANDTAVDYILAKRSWLRYDPALTQAQLREFITRLDNTGIPFNITVAPPDPGLGQDGQFAFLTNATPWRAWLKIAGTWVEQSAPIFADENYYTLDADDTGGQDVNTAQPWFPNRQSCFLTVWTHLFEGQLHLSRAAGGNSHTTSLLFGFDGLAIDWIKYVARAKTGDTAALAAESSVQGLSENATVVKAGSTNTTEQSIIEVRGIVAVNTEGGFIPQFKYSVAPGGAPTILKGSFFRTRSIGADWISGNWYNP